MELASIVQNGKLVPEEAWKRHVLALRHKVAAWPKLEAKSAGKAILAALEQATARRIGAGSIASVKKDGVKHGVLYGVLLSGGIDSTLLAFLAKQCNPNMVCFVVGIEGSQDLKAAEEAGAWLKVPLHTKILSPKEIEQLIPKLAAILPVIDTLSIGVGLVGYAAGTLAKQQGITALITGLGAEEIFAGYERHAEAADINAECWRGLLEVVWQRDFRREVALGTAAGIQALVPFLDPEVIITAMRISGREKISGEHKKVILRKAAEALGIPPAFTWRKKQAAQYGSGMDKALEKLARKHSFKTKGDYVRSIKPASNYSS